MPKPINPKHRWFRPVKDRRMTQAQDLLALAERVEVFEPTDRRDYMRAREHELNEQIAVAIGLPMTVKLGDSALGNERTVPTRISNYVGSLDAAASLVPEGWYWMAGNRDRITPRAYVENGKPAFEGIGSRRNPERAWFEVTAATPALALTAACLRALAHAHASKGGGE